MADRTVMVVPQYFHQTLQLLVSGYIVQLILDVQQLHPFQHITLDELPFHGQIKGMADQLDVVILAGRTET